MIDDADALNVRTHEAYRLEWPADEGDELGFPLFQLSEWMDVWPEGAAIHRPYPRRWRNACRGRHAALLHTGASDPAGLARLAMCALLLMLGGPWWSVCAVQTVGGATGSRRIRAFGAWALTVSALGVLIAKLGVPVAMVAMS
ncbi:transglutaminase [Xanthomonas fragariae]|nr:transglutaminase [Xanthomonas fragariae]